MPSTTSRPAARTPKKSSSKTPSREYEEAYRITTNRFRRRRRSAIRRRSGPDPTRSRKSRSQRRHPAPRAIRARHRRPSRPASRIVHPGEAPLSARPPAIPIGLPSELLERRPDIAAAERRVAEANDRIGIARAAFFPTLSLNAAAGYESTALTSLLSRSSFLWAVGPALSQTLFDAGRRRAVSEQALAAYDETVANYRQTSLTAFQQVEDNLAALRVLRQEAEHQRQATLSAQSAQQIFNNRYVGGIDTYLQVVTAQTTALINERNDIDIMRRQMNASVLLIKALGGGWNTASLPKL